MQQSLEDRLAEQDVWTFRECVGLGAQFGVKTRVVIVTLLALGKNYLDEEPAAPGTSDKKT